MKTFFDKLYAVYSAPPKNKAKLESVALQLSIRLNSIGRVLGTSWVSSSAHFIRGIWKNYPALYKHFHEASMDQNHTSSERAQYVGLKRKLSDANSALNMGLMLDALTKLQHLSLKLQDRNVTLSEAHHLISQKYHVFQSMTQNPGEFYEAAQNAANKLEFKEIKLEFGKAHKISQQDFFQKLSDNISIRMITTRASHIPSGSDTLLNREKYNQLVTIWRFWIDQNDLRKPILVLGMSRFVSWLKNWMCVSVVQSMESVNTSLVGTVTTFLVNFSHLQQL
jgi:hypothetical protein